MTYKINHYHLIRLTHTKVTSVPTYNRYYRLIACFLHTHLETDHKPISFFVASEEQISDIKYVVSTF